MLGPRVTGVTPDLTILAGLVQVRTVIQYMSRYAVGSYLYLGVRRSQKNHSAVVPPPVYTHTNTTSQTGPSAVRVAGTSIECHHLQRAPMRRRGRARRHQFCGSMIVWGARTCHMRSPCKPGRRSPHRHHLSAGRSPSAPRQPRARRPLPPPRRKARRRNCSHRSPERCARHLGTAFRGAAQQTATGVDAFSRCVAEPLKRRRRGEMARRHPRQSAALSGPGGARHCGFQSAHSLARAQRRRAARPRAGRSQRRRRHRQPN